VDGDWTNFEWVDWRSKVYSDVEVEKAIVDAVWNQLDSSHIIPLDQIATVRDGWAVHRVGWWACRLSDASLEETDEEIAEIKANIIEKDREYRLKFTMSDLSESASRAE
jgi:hypothetical protein